MAAPATEVLEALLAHGVTLGRGEHGRLEVDAPRGVLPDTS